MYECKLISNVFAIVIQLCLITLSIIILLVKRYFEVPKRNFKIFILDTSKQGTASIFSHYGNIIIAMIMSNVNFDGTQCGWYFISYIIDSVIGGLIISILLLKLLVFVAMKYNWEYLKNTGYYGNPINYKIYIIQMISWIIITIFSRLCSGIIVYILLNQLDIIVSFIDSLFSKFQLELTFVMIICPLFINLLSIVIIDGYLKKKTKKTGLLTDSSENIELNNIDDNFNTLELEMINIR